MHPSALIAPFLLAAGQANGFISGPSRLAFNVGVGVQQPARWNSRSAARQGGTAIAMSSTVPPQLPDVNQNLSGGDFDK